MTVFGLRLPLAASLLVWLVVWEIVGQAELLRLMIPPFSEVIASYPEMMASSRFWSALLITLEAYALGMALALVVGIGVGIAMGRNPTFGRVMGMWINIFESAPLTVVVPVLMTLMGSGLSTIVVTVFLFAVWIVALDTEAGVRHAGTTLVEMAGSFGAGRRDLYWKVILPAALPEILAGVRLAVIRGVKGVVIGQLLIAIIGVGRLFELYQRNFLMAEFWALIILLFAFAFAASGAVGWLERRVEYYAARR